MGDMNHSCRSRSRSRSRSIRRAAPSCSTLSRDCAPQERSKRTPVPRSTRFLDRWSSSDARGVQVSGSEVECKGTGVKEGLPYIYQQSEFIRICTDLIRKCDCESELYKFLSFLDDGSAVDLNDYSDPQSRKKFRHLGKALYLCRTGSLLSKPAECNISLLSVLHEKLPYIRQKIELQGPYTRPTQRSPKGSESPKESFSDLPGTLTAQEAAEVLSLREMHEQGFFVDYEKVHKEFMAKHAIHDVWGKTPQEQLQLLRAKECSASVEGGEITEPWKVFDREKEIVSASKIDKASYDRLLESKKDLSENFTRGQYHSSFV